MKPISFTVVVPAYNAAAFLERAVRSVTEQRYPQCRVVIVNDGSSDATGDIAAALAAENPRVYAIEQENSGQLLSRTNGVFGCGRRLFARQLGAHCRAADRTRL